jgi:hypothetical protein
LVDRIFESTDVNQINTDSQNHYSTVTDFAKFLG